MAAEPIVLNLQAAILALAKEGLGRPLSNRERAFITQREGLNALESILDCIPTLSRAELEQYLNAE